MTRAPHFPTAPLLSVSPANADAEPAQNAFYVVSITNTNDPAIVSFDSLYEVTFSGLDPDWLIGQTSSLPRTVPPGQTRIFFYFVQSPPDAPAGPQVFTITATEPDGDAGPVSAQQSASYTVVVPQIEDADLDGIPDADDNCVNDPNPSQLDTNADGFGNACDADFDNDGVVGSSDFAMLLQAYGSSVGDANYDPDIDVDGDGIIGGKEFSFLIRRFGTAPG